MFPCSYGGFAIKKHPISRGNFSLNASCLKIIEQESSKGWKLCFPVHDAVYAIGTPEQAEEIKELLEAEAARLKQPLSVKISSFKAGGVVCKCK